MSQFRACADSPVHRKHHAECETPEDPHSLRNLGINRVLWGAEVLFYVKEARNADTFERYGHLTPNDWPERKRLSEASNHRADVDGRSRYSPVRLVPGILIFTTQVVWVPFWGAGVINGMAHH